MTSLPSNIQSIIEDNILRDTTGGIKQGSINFAPSSGPEFKYVKINVSNNPVLHFIIEADHDGARGVAVMPTWNPIEAFYIKNPSVRGSYDNIPDEPETVTEAITDIIEHNTNSFFKKIAFKRNATSTTKHNVATSLVADFLIQGINPIDSTVQDQGTSYGLVQDTINGNFLFLPANSYDRGKRLTWSATPPPSGYNVKYMSIGSYYYYKTSTELFYMCVKGAIRSENTYGYDGILRYQDSTTGGDTGVIHINETNFLPSIAAVAKNEYYLDQTTGQWGGIPGIQSGIHDHILYMIKMLADEGYALQMTLMPKRYALTTNDAICASQVAEGGSSVIWTKSRGEMRSASVVKTPKAKKNAKGVGVVALTPDYFTYSQLEAMSAPTPMASDSQESNSPFDWQDSQEETPNTRTQIARESEIAFPNIKRDDIDETYISWNPESRRKFAESINPQNLYAMGDNTYSVIMILMLEQTAKEFESSKRYETLLERQKDIIKNISNLGTPFIATKKFKPKMSSIYIELNNTEYTKEEISNIIRYLNEYLETITYTAVLLETYPKNISSESWKFYQKIHQIQDKIIRTIEFYKNSLGDDYKKDVDKRAAAVELISFLRITLDVFQIYTQSMERILKIVSIRSQYVEPVNIPDKLIEAPLSPTGVAELPSSPIVAVPSSPIRSQVPSSPIAAVSSSFIRSPIPTSPIRSPGNNLKIQIPNTNPKLKRILSEKIQKNPELVNALKGEFGLPTEPRPRHTMTTRSRSAKGTLKKTGGKTHKKMKNKRNKTKNNNRKITKSKPNHKKRRLTKKRIM